MSMKTIGLAGLAIGLGVVTLSGCGRSREAAVPERAERSAASSSAYVTDVGEIKVEYRPVAIPDRMAPNSRADVQFEAKNTGAKAWPSGGDFPLVFGYHWASPAVNGEWETVLWDDSNRGVLKADTKPGESVIVTLPVHALPRACPSCKLVIAPLLEMKAWSESARYVAPVNIS
jgi:hypothetical protein